MVANAISAVDSIPILFPRAYVTFKNGGAFIPSYDTITAWMMWTK